MEQQGQSDRAKLHGMGLDRQGLAETIKDSLYQLNKVNR